MNRKLYRAPFFLVYSLLVLFSPSCGSSEFTEKDAKAQMSLLLPEVSGEGCLPILLERHDDVNSFVLVLDSRDKTVTGLKSKISKQLLEAGWGEQERAIHREGSIGRTRGDTDRRSHGDQRDTMSACCSRL